MSTSLLDKTEMGQHFAGEQSLGALTFGVLEPRMHIWASDLWKSDMIAYRSVGHSPALGSLALWVAHYFTRNRTDGSDFPPFFSAHDRSRPSFAVAFVYVSGNGKGVCLVMARVRFLVKPPCSANRLLV